MKISETKKKTIKYGSEVSAITLEEESEEELKLLSL